MKKFILIITFLICINLPFPCNASDMDATFYINNGVSKFELGDYKGSIEDYTKAIQLDPKNYDGYLRRGGSKSKLEDYNGAIEDYTRAIELNPDNYKGYLNRGICEYELKDYNNSIVDCTNAIKLNSDCAWAYFYRGKSRNELKDYAGSSKDSKKFDEQSAYIKKYFKKINKIVKANWKPPLKKPGTGTIVRYTLNKKGVISNIRIVQPSVYFQNDESAIKALKTSSPLPPLPSEFQGESLDIEFRFEIEPIW